MYYENPSLQIGSFTILNLRGVSTNLTDTMKILFAQFEIVNKTFLTFLIVSVIEIFGSKEISYYP